MTISPLGSSPYVPAAQSGMRQDMQGVRQALAAGDLAGAQQAFAAFKTDFHQAHGGHSLYQTQVPFAIKQDLQNLQAALKGGDLAGAQQAFATFQQDFQARNGHSPEPPVGGPTPEQTVGLNVTA